MAELFVIITLLPITAIAFSVFRKWRRVSHRESVRKRRQQFRLIRGDKAS